MQINGPKNPFLSLSTDAVTQGTLMASMELSLWTRGRRQADANYRLALQDLE